MGMERGISQAINTFLQYQENLGKLLFSRNNSFVGCITRRNGSQGFVKNGKRGSPDYYIFLPNGLTIHLEIKTERSKQSVDQLAWEMKCKNLGHEYFIVRSVDETEKIIKRILLFPPHKKYAK